VCLLLLSLLGEHVKRIGRVDYWPKGVLSLMWRNRRYISHPQASTFLMDFRILCDTYILNEISMDRNHALINKIMRVVLVSIFHSFLKI
jgi:hypothetical protein